MAVPATIDIRITIFVPVKVFPCLSHPKKAVILHVLM